MSVRSISTEASVPAPNNPSSDRVYDTSPPSSPAAGPVIDHCAGPSAGPPIPCVSFIVVVTVSAAALTATLPPVAEPALARSIEKSSAPSTNTSSISIRSISRSSISSPSAAAVKVMVPVAESKVTAPSPEYAVTAV